VRQLLLLSFACILTIGGYSQIVPDSTYNPLIKRHRTIYQNLIGQQIDTLVTDDLIAELQKYRGQKIHVNLWSVTCRPCIQEFPELIELKDDYAEQGINFVAIAKEEKSKTDRILQINPLSWDLLFDGSGLFDDLGVKQYPVNLFIDEGGIVSEITLGVFMKGKIVDGRTVMSMNNLPYYEMILSSWTKE
jgi:thiol-disulfide isomerase/thioredoxin